MKPNTQAVSGVHNHGRQHGKPAPLPAQPTPPPAQAEPRAARPANPPNPPLLKGGEGGAGRTFPDPVLSVECLVLSEDRTERAFAHLLAGKSGTEEALAAARAGDVALLDRIELAFLNAWGPKPTPPEDVPAQLLDEYGMELAAIEILHGGDETLIEWGYVQPCPRCWKRISKRKGCRKCQGWGYLNGGGHEEYGIWRFQTDTDLRVTSDAVATGIEI